MKPAAPVTKIVLLSKVTLLICIPLLIADSISL